MKTAKNRQQGMGFAGLVVIIVLAIFVAILGMKVVPAYLHNAEIARLLKAVASDPQMQSATAKDIHEAYNKRAMMDSITDITPEDIVIDKDSGRLVLSVSYSKKIPVAGNMSLLLEFNTSSAK